jgi:hypothetical protein
VGRVREAVHEKSPVYVTAPGVFIARE